MGISYRKDVTRKSVYVKRFVYVLLTVVILAITCVELSVALDLEFTRTLVRPAMLIGSLSWVILAILTQVDEKKYREDEEYELPWIVQILLTIIAAGSVAGSLYVSVFVSFALWANAIFWILFCFEAVILYLDMLKETSLYLDNP